MTQTKPHTKVSALLLALAACATLAGCNQPQAAQSAVAAAPAQPAIDQANLCEVKAWQHDAVSQACKPGQKVVFAPDSWGNEQLPVFFAAVNCDMRFAVAMTKGAVSCIYGPITPKKAP